MERWKEILQVLLIEDCEETRRLVTRAFATTQVQLDTATDLKSALSLLTQKRFGLILLDLGLPDGDGMELLAHVSKIPQNADTSVVLLTGKENVEKKIEAFSLGADDYITKPFHPLELRARVESKLRRLAKRAQAPEEFRIGSLLIQMVNQRVFRIDGELLEEISLTPLEFKILIFLARQQGRTYSREEILKGVWGGNVHVHDRTVDTHVCSLRRKLGELSKYIQSVPGSGYRYAA